jgi:hypothetical protein
MHAAADSGGRHQHLCTLTNGGGNYDYDTGMLIPTLIP